MVNAAGLTVAEVSWAGSLRGCRCFIRRMHYGIPTKSVYDDGAHPALPKFDHFAVMAVSAAW